MNEECVVEAEWPDAFSHKIIGRIYAVDFTPRDGTHQ